MELMAKPSRLSTRAYHELFAVGSVRSRRMAALGFVVANANTTRSRSRGKIIEIDRLIEIEQAALTGHQRRLDSGAMGVQLVEHLVEQVFLEPIEVGVENVGERPCA